MLILWHAQTCLQAGCISLGSRPTDSNCLDTLDALEWENPPTREEVYAGKAQPYDALLADAAFSSGVYVGGPLQFALKQEGRFLLEVFLIVLEEGRDSFVLEVENRPADRRHEAEPGQQHRLRPKTSHRHLDLLAVVLGGQAIRVVTKSPRYILSAVRWTPLDEFDADVAPRLLQHQRTLFADPFDTEGHGYPFARRNYLEQISSRLALSSQPEIRREGAVGLARALYWLAVENHEPHDIRRFQKSIGEALQLAPENPILQQTASSYCLGLNQGSSSPRPADFCDSIRPIPWDVVLPPAPAGAPDWAVAQRKLIGRLEVLTRWWVEERQRGNGELGGGWGDDVEILRSWGAQALGFGSRVAAQGIRTMADGIWHSGLLLNGYDRRISDVEHSSEPTTDTQPLLAALYPEDRDVLGRLAETAGCTRNWIRLQPDGRWRFDGSWYNCNEFDPDERRRIDVHMNTRAVGPALWYAYLTSDPETVELLARWAESWVEAMRSEEHGKPSGIFPPVLNSRDGSYLIGSSRWDQPQAEWDYYQWSGGSQDALTSLLLAFHDLTGQHRWLEAAGESLAPLQRCPSHPGLCREMLAASQSFFEWRRLSGDGRYDQLFAFAADPDLVSLRRELTRLAEVTEARLSVNLSMFTSEAIFTDRVYYQMPPEYRRLLFGGESPRGDRYPSFAVTWPHTSGQFARAVVSGTPESLSLLAYNFEPTASDLNLRVWRLKPGRYRCTLLGLEDQLFRDEEILIPQKAALVSLSIPSRTETCIQLLRIGDI